MAHDFKIRTGAMVHAAAAGRYLWLALVHGGLALRVLAGQLLATIVAVVVVFEEWGWRPLAVALGRLAGLRPVAALEAWIRSLPPYAALAIFGLPSILLLPLKLLALYLVAQGYKVAAAALFVGAKVVGTAIVARLFLLTQAALMRIGWFKRAYDVLMPLKAALLAWVRETWAWRYGRVIKWRLKARFGPTFAALRMWARGLFRRG